MVSKFASMVASLAIATWALNVAPARAEYPDKPITMIVPWAAGGSTDQTARVLAKAAEASLGQPVVIINQPGASTTIGLAALASAKPDGYTIGTLSSTGYLVALQGRQLPFHPIDSFTYISYYGDNVIGVAVRSDSPWKSLKDLVEDGKARPGAIKYGTAGVGTTQHLTTEALQFSSKAKFVHIPQQGSAASMPSLLGKHVDFVTETSVWAPFVEDKQVRLLAVTTPKRSKLYPDVPTLTELGYKSLRSVQAIIGPAGIPEPIRMKLEGAFRTALKDKAFQETMDRLAMETIDLPGPEVKKLVEGEYELASELVKEIGKSK
ncbi:tripartite tricarboxylate transporter substrate binding protein [Bradyrhizobium sp. NP1]|uniref:tripartite tricarboxylate transporter substrate binding protein n=1 Tax=Bradyrhizobium sp. NP1 TaxID=3049772 RepID=UPI0025A59BC9|nr:tripartite tricarboxylate transporter substrate binding protein [Bradyrhizobium sp. NP1]WJR80877.1 tripartite tricarboxylate transporter substrate binding protein [Bradyrhizobium sp. NP1]